MVRTPGRMRACMSCQRFWNASRLAAGGFRQELEVLRLIAEGVRTPAIARELGISVGTVEVHRRSIMRKLGLHAVAELTRYAIREGLIAP
jgi:DNA-binding NarL/FixJ family response regulator